MFLISGWMGFPSFYNCFMVIILYSVITPQPTDMIFNYLKKSFARKRARRIFCEYPIQVSSYHLAEEGTIEFGNWMNPLLGEKVIIQSEVNFFKQFIPKGSLAIDIGGNTGDTTVPMGLAAGKEGLVLGFDPNPHVFKVLDNNAGLNKDKTNIVALPFAISSEEGEFYYGSSEASYSNGGIAEEANKKHGNFTLAQKVKGVNLQHYLEKHYASWLDKLSFIKIDTEGHDKEIIKSIAGLIIKYKPVVIAEVFTQLTREERYELYDVIADKGYDLFYFGDFDTNAAIKPIQRNDMTNWPHFNVYALPKGK